MPEIKLTFLFRVYFRVSADGEDLGQINFELFDEVNFVFNFVALVILFANYFVGKADL